MPQWEEENGHWVAAYVEAPDRPVRYFDSLHLEPPPLLQEWLDQFVGVDRNERRYQAGEVNNCGAYAIIFLYFMTLGYTYPRFIDFIESSPFPDLFVNGIVNKMNG
jgi:hypothetical protein